MIRVRNDCQVQEQEQRADVSSFAFLLTSTHTGEQPGLTVRAGKLGRLLFRPDTDHGAVGDERRSKEDAFDSEGGPTGCELGQAAHKGTGVGGGSKGEAYSAGATWKPAKRQNVSVCRVAGGGSPEPGDSPLYLIRSLLRSTTR